MSVRACEQDEESVLVLHTPKNLGEYPASRSLKTMCYIQLRPSNTLDSEASSLERLMWLSSDL